MEIFWGENKFLLSVSVWYVLGHYRNLVCMRETLARAEKPHPSPDPSPYPSPFQRNKPLGSVIPAFDPNPYRYPLL